MASDSEDPDGAATRLEAALERIAAVAARSPAPVAGPEAVAPQLVTIAPEAIARLDSLIDRLRGALSGRTG